MELKNLIPKRNEVSRKENSSGDFFRSEMDRIFDRFFRGFELEPFHRFGLESVKDSDLLVGCVRPRVNVTEDSDAIKITAELPGMDEKDIELFVTSDSVSLKGEKKQETEEKHGEHYCLERAYGRFERTIPLPSEIHTDRVEAVYKKGILTITLPKTEEAKSQWKKVPIIVG